MNLFLPTMALPAVYADLTPRERRACREAYVVQQGGLCHHCKAPLSGAPAKKVARQRVTPHLYPPGFFDHPVHLHHSHDTGMTLGAVHNHCNAVLWEHHGE
jgi:hypothetical protein